MKLAIDSAEKKELARRPATKEEAPCLVFRLRRDSRREDKIHSAPAVGQPPVDRKDACRLSPKHNHLNPSKEN